MPGDSTLGVVKHVCGAGIGESGDVPACVGIPDGASPASAGDGDEVTHGMPGNPLWRTDAANEGDEQLPGRGVPDGAGLVVVDGCDAGAVGAPRRIAHQVGVSGVGGRGAAADRVPDGVCLGPVGDDGQAGAVRTPVDPVHPVGAAGERGDSFPGVGVPDDAGPVAVNGRDAGAVGAPGDTHHECYPGREPEHEGGDRFSCVRIPDRAGSVVAGGRDPGAVGTPRHPERPFGVIDERDDGLAGVGIPDDAGVVPAGGDQTTAVRTPRDPVHRVLDPEAVMSGEGEDPLCGVGVPDDAGSAI